MPRWTLNLLVVGILLALIPLALVTRDRIVSHGDRTRISLIPDMDKQPKFKAQEASALFADGRAARTEPAGTVARGELLADAAFVRGPRRRRVGERRSRLRWTRTCSRAAASATASTARPATGWPATATASSHERALALAEGGWTPPSDLHTDLVRERPVGQLFNTISDGHPQHAGLRAADPAAGPLGDRRLRAGPAAEPARAPGGRARRGAGALRWGECDDEAAAARGHQPGGPPTSGPAAGAPCA